MTTEETPHRFPAGDDTPVKDYSCHISTGGQYVYRSAADGLARKTSCVGAEVLVDRRLITGVIVSQLERKPEPGDWEGTIKGLTAR